MRFATPLRSLLNVAFALNMAMGLLHGPSMSFAEHRAPGPAQAAHHMGHAGAHHAQSGHDTVISDEAPNPIEADGTAHAVPNCPLANVTAITPQSLVAMRFGNGAKLMPMVQHPLRQADLAALDPPPRRVA